VEPQPVLLLATRDAAQEATPPFAGFSD